METNVLVITASAAPHSAAAAMLEITGVRHQVACLGEGARQALGDPRGHATIVLELSCETTCRALRDLRADRRHSRLPVVAALHAPAQVDVYEALEAGASDVLALPMESREFALRVRSHIRRAARMRGIRRIDLGGRILDFDAHHIMAGDRRQEVLTPRESAILEHLVRSPGRPATTEELLVEALGYPPRRGNPEVVRTHVRHLRQKIEEDPARPRFLLNVPRVGYRLVIAEAALQNFT